MRTRYYVGNKKHSPCEEDDQNKRFWLITGDGETISCLGRLLAQTEGPLDSSDDGWVRFALYKLVDGGYACRWYQHTTFESEDPTYGASVCDSKEEVIEFFGDSDPAEELYQRVGFG